MADLTSIGMQDFAENPDRYRLPASPMVEPGDFVHSRASGYQHRVIMRIHGARLAPEHRR